MLHLYKELILFLAQQIHGRATCKRVHRQHIKELHQSKWLDILKMPEQERNQIINTIIDKIEVA